MKYRIREKVHGYHLSQLKPGDTYITRMSWLASENHPPTIFIAGTEDGREPGKFKSTSIDGAYTLHRGSLAVLRVEAVEIVDGVIVFEVCE